jgi:hypothetical protein
MAVSVVRRSSMSPPTIIIRRPFSPLAHLGETDPQVDSNERPEETASRLGSQHDSRCGSCNHARESRSQVTQNRWVPPP